MQGGGSLEIPSAGLINRVCISSINYSDGILLARSHRQLSRLNCFSIVHKSVNSLSYVAQDIKFVG